MTQKSSLDNTDFSKGAFYPPTVIEGVNVQDELWNEEVFGPVCIVKRFSVSSISQLIESNCFSHYFQTESEGVELANHCKYGLGAGIWTTDLSRAHRVSDQIEAGIVWVNTHHRNDPSSPWGGMKESGIGRENGIEAYNACELLTTSRRVLVMAECYVDTQSKSTIINIASTDETRNSDDWFGESIEAKRYG